jgi:hypothetical protein
VGRPEETFVSWLVKREVVAHPLIRNYLVVMKKCPYCGRENDDTLAVCSECGVELTRPPAPGIDPQLTDPALSLVTIATFSSPQEASLLVARLEAAGIEACIPEEYGAQVFSAVIPMERLTVRVAAKDYEAAKALIAEE